MLPLVAEKLAFGERTPTVRESTRQRMATLFAPRRPDAAPPDLAGAPLEGRLNTRTASPRPASARSTTTSPPFRVHGAYARGREAAALLLFVSAIFLVLALASFEGDPQTPQVEGANWIGPVGASCARFFLGAIGVTAWVIPVELLLLAWPLLKDRASIATLTRLAGDFLVILVIAALVQVAFPGASVHGAMPAAGSFGELFGELMRSLFSTIGSFLIGFTIIGLILIGRASFSFIAWMQKATQGTELAAAKAAQGAKVVAQAWASAAELRRQREQQAPKLTPVIHEPSPAEGLLEAIAPEPENPPTAPVLHVESAPRTQSPSPAEPPWFRLRKGPTPDEPTPSSPEVVSCSSPTPPTPTNPDLQPPPEPELPSPVPRGRRRYRKDDALPPHPSEPPAVRIHSAPAEHTFLQLPPPTTASATPLQTPELKPEPEPEPEPKREPSPQPEPEHKSTPKPKPAKKLLTSVAEEQIAAERAREEGPRIFEKVEEPKPRPKPAPQRPTMPEHFQLPGPELLDPAPATVHRENPEVLLARAKELERVLANYGVKGTVMDIHTGPTVSTFELIPAEGTKVRQVAGLDDDLALGLSCKVRIVAPIPGKNRIGFELPNRERIPVNLRELIEDRKFQELNVPLPVVLGRDIVGAPFYADLSNMPHVIVAGATGAGKSVGLNVMLVSLLMRRTPEQLRMLMIDPKVVELAPFDRIPHLLLPVVTDMKLAANALKWAVDEMERRYQLFANAGTKNIATYNAWVERAHRGEIKAFAPPKANHTTTEDGSLLEISPEREAPQLPEKIPYIVIVVDEFADLIMQQGKDVEAAIARLAQKARAAGMHVILATQRPSTDVITGTIKSNFPSRIAFRVAQWQDSKTILDEKGAEQLLGKGDMLVKLNGSTDTRRVQGPFIFEEEVQRVCDFLRAQGEPVYDESITRNREEDEIAEPDEVETDPKYEEAVRVVAETRKCSTSWLQRKLGLGYNRAAKIVEVLEKRGIVGPANGSKEREVLIGPP
ncbi:MAG: DNA translocase FtsK [Myxococcales bacterium]|nr:DNA translocase FtsK [Polyangiaceae bacterium]MDW8250920.1 DNA translocase FtsK [Myxococcales bacterium]